MGGRWRESSRKSSARSPVSAALQRLCVAKSKIGLTSELDLVYTFDAEGRVLTVPAPQQPVRTHYYDTMGRPQRLTESGADLVSNIAYNAAGR